MGHTVDSLPEKLSTPHDSTSQWTHRSLVEDCDISIVPWTFTLHSLQSFPGCSEKVIEITDSMMGEESNKQKQDKKISVVKIFPQFYAEPMFSNCCSNFPLCHLGIPALALFDVGCKNASGDQPAHRPVPEAQPQAEINFWSPLPYTRTATASIQFWGLPGDKSPAHKVFPIYWINVLPTKDVLAVPQRKITRTVILNKLNNWGWICPKWANTDNLWTNRPYVLSQSAKGLFWVRKNPDIPSMSFSVCRKSEVI